MGHNGGRDDQGRSTTMGTVHELVDSAPLLGDWAALRRRIHDDGYVFVRGVLDPELVRRVGRECLSRLQRAGWSEPGGRDRGEAEGAGPGDQHSQRRSATVATGG